jgi:hypothetical protein
VRHRLLRFVSAALFFAISAGVSFGGFMVGTSAADEEVKHRCVVGGGGEAQVVVCTPWD